MDERFWCQECEKVVGEDHFPHDHNCNCADPKELFPCPVHGYTRPEIKPVTE